MQLHTGLKQDSCKIIVTLRISVSMFHLKKGLKTQCWKGTHCSHDRTAGVHMPILLRPPLAQAAFWKLASKHCSSATCMQVCNYCHNGRMQSIFTQPLLLNTLLLLEIPIKVKKMSHPFVELSPDNCTLVSDRYPQFSLLWPGLSPSVPPYIQITTLPQKSVWSPSLWNYFFPPPISSTSHTLDLIPART